MTMRHESSLMQKVRDALRQAASNLQNLKMNRADEDQNVARLILELRSAIPEPESQNVAAD